MFLDQESLKKHRPIVLRAIAYALLLSHDIRRDTDLWLLLRMNSQEYGLLHLTGSSLRHLRPDESSSWGILRKCLKILYKLQPSSSRKAHEGIHVCRFHLISELLERFPRGYTLRVVDVGTKLSPPSFAECLPQGNILLLLDADISRLSAGELEILRNSGCKIQCLALPLKEFTLDQIIAIVNWLLDRWFKNAN